MDLGDMQPYREEAEELLHKEAVQEVHFSRRAYQVGVLHQEELFWVFIQLTELGELQEAFCSCESVNQCLHILVALLFITRDGEPLHVCFERSFWKRLAHLFADLFGFESLAFQKRENEEFFIEKEGVSFLVQGEGTIPLFEERPRETPETSLKFSNLAPEEIQWWREGRPSKELRFELSLWSDLAKWLFLLEEDEKKPLTFLGTPPDHFEVQFSNQRASVHFGKEHLPELLPTLSTVKSNVSIQEEKRNPIREVHFDTKRVVLKIAHDERAPVLQTQEPVETIGEWSYSPSLGFFREQSDPLPEGEIDAEELPELLELYGELINPFIPVDPNPRAVSYKIFFDETWNWHFDAYLKTRHDLDDAILFDGWIYLESTGFFKVEHLLFNQVRAKVSPSDVSAFVNTHRVFLNRLDGWATHIAGLEFPISYSVDEEGTLLFSSGESESTTMDFGEWVYIQGEGFYAKKEGRVGSSVRAGVRVDVTELPAFLSQNRDELENIRGFFLNELPLASRGCEIALSAQGTIKVMPVYNLTPAYKGKWVQFFGPYVYVTGEGFFELPPKMRLPEAFKEPREVRKNQIPHFLRHEMEAIRGKITSLDKRLTTPHQLDLELSYLVRKLGGGLYAKLSFLSEMGSCSLVDLLSAREANERFLFSDAGFIDLDDERFRPLLHLKVPFDRDLDRVEMSALDLLYLEVSEGLKLPAEDSLQAQVTRKILEELRNFTVSEPAQLDRLKSRLRPYQETGLGWLWFLYQNALSGILCDDMGLGKTHQAMALMAAVSHKKKCRILVVCPTSVIYHWEDKLDQFLPSLPVHTFHGQKRSLRGFPQDGVLLTSYGIARTENEKLCKLSFEIAIYDELQVAKNASSRIHAALRKIDAKMRVGLTGTPIENTLLELKALFDLVLPGYMPSNKEYRQLFVLPIEKHGDEEKAARLKSLVRPFILRRKKQEVLTELPAKIEEKAYCALSDEQKTLYQEILAGTRKELLPQLTDPSKRVPYPHIFAILGKLKQVCNHPSLFKKEPNHYQKSESGKWELFVELLSEAQASNQKVVIFTQYLHMLDIFQKYLREQNLLYAEIRGETKDRREELQRFQNNPECKIFLGSLQAAGLGIDLTAASTMILYDRWWNRAREAQAIDRIHRIGQTRGVTVYKLITKGTIEERIDALIERKGRLMEEIVQTDDEAELKSFTREEILELLAPLE